MFWVGLAVAAASAYMQKKSADKSAQGAKKEGKAQAIGQYLQGKAKIEEGKGILMLTAHQAMLQELEADGIRRASQEKADLLRGMAQRFRATQTARAAVSGVVTSEGSAGVMREDTTLLAERDAIVALMTGSTQALMQEFSAEMTRMAGKQQAQAAFQEGEGLKLGVGDVAKAGAEAGRAATAAGRFQAGSTLAQGALTAYSHYKADKAAGATT